MRRAILTAALIAVSAGLIFAQQVYNPRLLESLGISQEQADQIGRIQEEMTAALRRLQADQEIKKAELARILIEEEPDMRQVERNLRDSSEIEVQLRLNEIKREISIRSIIGMDSWTRLMAAARNQREVAARQQAAPQQGAAQSADRLGEMQQSVAEQQERVANTLRQRRELLEDPDIQERFQQLQELFGELQRLIRERSQ